MKLLTVDEARGEAFDPLELLTDEEFEAQMARDNAAVDHYIAKTKSLVGGKPWHIERHGDQYCVVLDAGNETVKCHPSRAEALAHMRALYANEKYSPDQPRDDQGRFGEGSSADPMADVKFRIGTMREEDQQVVRDRLDKLGSKYPSVVSLIKTVSGAPLKTRWGSMDDRGNMKFTNLGSKSDSMVDPTLDNTVAHEFGHALFRDMAGIEEPNDRPMSFSQQIAQGVPYSVARDSISEYNATVREQESGVNSIVVGLYQKVSDVLGTGKVYDQLVKEFTGNPQYVASSKQELLAEAFGHYQTGQHGVIADIVGHAIDDHYGVTS